MKVNVLKMLGYLLTTALITLGTQLDSLNYDFSSFTTGHWMGLAIKSLIPGLVTLKAYFELPNNTPPE